MHFTVFSILAYASTISAFGKFNVPNTVTAGQDLTLTVGSRTSFDAQFDTFRLYLSVSGPNTGLNPSCLLLNNTAITAKSVTVNIPASVGPSGLHYSIVTVELNVNGVFGSDATASGFQYSNEFSLSGGTSSFSDWENANKAIGDEDEIPCSAYDCARQCAQKYYSQNQDLEGAKCIQACPGVVYDVNDLAYLASAAGSATTAAGAQQTGQAASSGQSGQTGSTPSTSSSAASATVTSKASTTGVMATVTSSGMSKASSSTKSGSGTSSGAVATQTGGSEKMGLSVGILGAGLALAML